MWLLFCSYSSTVTALRSKLFVRVVLTIITIMTLTSLVAEIMPDNVVYALGVVVICVCVVVVSMALYASGVLWHAQRASVEYPEFYAPVPHWHWTLVGLSAVLGCGIGVLTMLDLAAV